jgi:outer membrane protein assembly factor BamB
VDFDVILEFDKNGRPLQRYAFWDHLKEYQPFHAKFGVDLAPFFSISVPWLGPLKAKTYDYFHLNCLTIIPPNALESKNPVFHRGNWLISLLHGSMVFILDKDTKKILWHMAANDVQGGLQGQHSVSMLPDGDILLFENGVDRKASRILIIDPLTFQIKWEYQHANFYSENIGFVQVLDNGNFLVTESNQGHGFELTPDKKIVWEYYSPRNEIHSMIRYPQKMIDHLLQTNGSPP